MVAVALGLLAAPARGQSAQLQKVVTMLKELKAKVADDGVAEQESYDKYACWCEETMARKAKEIGEAKEKIDELSQLIVKLKGENGAHGAEIKQLEKEIAENQESVREATELREKEAAEYQAEKIEN